MNKNDMKNPLIQSGIILLIIFLLIAIVANAEPHGFIGSVAALASGILFFIGLVLAIAISIAIIIGLFIAAVSIHSIDKARDLTEQLKSMATNLYNKLSTGSIVARRNTQPGTRQPQETNTSTISTEHYLTLTASVDELKVQVKQQQQLSAALAARLDSLSYEQTMLLEKNDTAPAITELKDFQQQATTLLETGETSLKGMTKRLDEIESRLTEGQRRLAAELGELQERTAIPEMISGVLSYIDRPEDRELINEKAQEAVARGMTYSQIDDFFRSALRPELFETLSAHPRLTKDLIRSVKKRFD